MSSDHSYRLCRKLFKIYLFIYFWLCWVFTAVQAFLCLQQMGVLSSCSPRASHCGGFSCCGARAVGRGGSAVAALGLWSTGSAAVARGLSCSATRGVLLDKESNPRLLRWQAYSLPLSPQGNPATFFNVDGVLVSIFQIMIRNFGGEAEKLIFKTISRWLWYYARLKNYLFQPPMQCSGASLVAQVKVSACNEGDMGSILGSGRSPGEGNGNPLQYSCLENPMDGGAWWATSAHGVTKSQTWLSNFTFTSLCNAVALLWKPWCRLFQRWMFHTPVRTLWRDFMIKCM